MGSTAASSDTLSGRLARGDFPRLAYRLGRAGASGELLLSEGNGTQHRLILRRGYVSFAQVAGLWAPLGELLRAEGSVSDAQIQRSLESVVRDATLQGRALIAQGAATEAEIDAALRRQSELRLSVLAELAGATWTLRPAAAMPPGGRPIALVHWVRRYLDERLTEARARLVLAELSRAPCALRPSLAPDPSTLDDVDRRLVAALLAGPCRLADLVAIRGATQARVVALLHFLRGVDGLVECPVKPQAPPRPTSSLLLADALTEAHRILGVAPTADEAAVKKAYRKIVHELHPDLHQGLPPHERRRLELRLAKAATAYRAIVRSP